MGNFSNDVESLVRIFIVISFISSTVLFPIMIFLIVKKSKQMKKYRFYLLNTVIWCYIYHLIVFINHINPIFPSPCVMFHPILPLGQNAAVIMFYLAFFAIMNLDLSIVWSLFYRFSQAYPGWLCDFVDKTKYIYLVYACIYFFVYTTVLIPMMIAQRWDWNETQIQFLNSNPDLAAYVNSPMICYKNVENFRLFELYVSIIFLVFFFVGNFLHGVLIHLTQKSRNSLLTSTYRMHMMLLTAISVQMIIGYMLLLLPVVVQGFLIYYENENTGRFSTVTLALFSTHGTIDDFTMIYFIKPWRETILNWIRRPKPANRTGPIIVTRTSNW